MHQRTLIENKKGFGDFQRSHRIECLGQSFQAGPRRPILHTLSSMASSAGRGGAGAVSLVKRKYSNCVYLLTDGYLPIGSQDSQVSTASFLLNWRRL